jgi:enterochelin esterase family protein
MKHVLPLALLTLCLCSPLANGQTLPGKPLPTNIQPNGYPRLLDNGSVVFRMKAPNAQRIQLSLGTDYDLTKDDQGFWTVTTAPVVPGFHYYSLIVDGVTVADPASESFYGMSRMASGIDIPEAGIDFYDVKNVPHGAISSRYYYSNVTQSWRRLLVYTPPGYDARSRTRYPVVYVQHGGGEDERGWATQGKIDCILDNAIAEGKVKPLIAVLTNGNVSSGAAGGYSAGAMKNVTEEILHNVIPFIDRTYRTLSDAGHRALCGLSMGGGQAFYVGLTHLDQFASVGIFSSGIFGGISNPSQKSFDAEREIPGLLSRPDSVQRKCRLLYVSVGEQDPRFEFTRKEMQHWQGKGLNVLFHSFPGDHEWQVWRKSFNDYARQLFQW